MWCPGSRPSTSWRPAMRPTATLVTSAIAAMAVTYGVGAFSASERRGRQLRRAIAGCCDQRQPQPRQPPVWATIAESSSTTRRAISSSNVEVFRRCDGRGRGARLGHRRPEQIDRASARRSRTIVPSISKCLRIYGTPLAPRRPASLEAEMPTSDPATCRGRQRRLGDDREGKVRDHLGRHRAPPPTAGTVARRTA